MLLDAQRSLLLLVDVQEKLTPLVHEHARLVTHCHWLLTIAKLMEIPIVVSEQYPKGLGGTVAELAPFITKENYITKTHFSCAEDPVALTTIKDTQRDQVVLIGIEAHVCVLQTALGLHDQDFNVFVVADVIASRDIQDKKFALKRMQHSGIHVVTREMVVFEWLKKSNTELFKTISKNYLR